MTDQTQQKAAAGGAAKERFRFSLAQLFGCVLILCLVLGTFRLLATLESVSATILVVFVGTLGILIVVRSIAARKMTWIRIGVTAGLVTALASYTLTAVYFARGSARHVGCKMNLSQIAIGMHNYHAHFGCLPPASIADANGKPIHSWRVLLLPYLGRSDLYQRYRFDEPWNGPSNRKLHNEIVDVYCCPEQRARSAGNATAETSYVVVVGPRTAFPGDRCVSFGDITDGISNTVLVVEVKNSGIHWMEPRDLHVTQMNTRINAPRGQGISSFHQGGAQAAIADGAVRYLSDELTASEVTSLLNIDDGPMP